jgi:spermidine synthase
VRVGDARVTLRGEETDSADLVVGDAFGGLAVPWHLATVEFAEDIRRVLRPDGLYLLNVIDYEPLGLVRAEAATLRQVFEHVALVGHPEPGGNHVFLASDAPLPALPTSARARELDPAEADALRDADAPADQLLTPG